MGFVGGFPTGRRDQDDRRRLQERRARSTATCRSPRSSPTLFVNGWKSTGRDPSGLKVVKFPLAPGDYSSQAAQVGDDADCLFGNISEVNWPPLITAPNGVGASAAPVRPAGQPRRQGHRRAVPGARPRAAIVVNVYPDIDGRRVGRLPGGAREVRRSRPRLEQPRRARDLDRVHGVHPDRRGHGG